MEKLTDLNAVPEIVNASRIKTEYASMVESLKEGSLFIVTHPEVDAVILSREKWNEVMEEIESLRAALDAEAEYDAGMTSSVEDLDKDFKKLLAENKHHGRTPITKSPQQNKQNRKTRSA